MDSHFHLRYFCFSAEPPGLDYSAIKFHISENHSASKNESILDSSSTDSEDKKEFYLLDLYCGCGAMSTGMCLGMNLAGVNLVTVRHVHSIHCLFSVRPGLGAGKSAV